MRENASMCRQGIPDYLITMRAPGDVAERVKHTAEDYPVSKWQRVASPVWMDIDPSDTLQYASAREHDDERKIKGFKYLRSGVLDERGFIMDQEGYGMEEWNREWKWKDKQWKEWRPGLGDANSLNHRAVELLQQTYWSRWQWQRLCWTADMFAA